MKLPGKTLLAAALLAATTHAALASPTGMKNVTGTVFVIVMENSNWSKIKSSSYAPYINSLLSHPQASYANAYYNPTAIHPSEPNYIWMEGGNNFGIKNDSDPTTNKIIGKDHLTKQLEAKGISWKTYQESMPTGVCPLSSSGKYAAKHNPFIFFDDVSEGFKTNSAKCISHVRPFTELAGDMSNNRMARYVFITPNLCNDMHDSCAPLYNGVKQGDAWLKALVPQIMASQAYQNNGALMITWDEGGSGSDGPIGFILLSPQARGNGYYNNFRYTHSSLLRSLQTIYGVGPLLNDANNATDLNDLFK
jgi:hypothetical protein